MKKKALWLGALSALLLAASLTFLVPQKSSALGFLSYNWSCGGSFPNCNLSVTSRQHQAYQWNFGDGTISSCSTSKNISHTYTVGAGEHQFLVSLIGYATTSCGSPDNIIGCTITVGSGPGGHPGFSGSCS